MDPFRAHRTTRVDYLLIGVAMIVCVGLVAWAFLG